MTIKESDVKKYNESFNPHGYKLVDVKLNTVKNVAITIFVISLIAFGGFFLYLVEDEKFRSNINVEGNIINVTDADTINNEYKFDTPINNKYEIHLDLNDLECINFTG